MDTKKLSKKTSEGLAHGLINSLANSCSVKQEDKIKTAKKSEYDKIKSHDAEIVKVRYINYLGNHERLETPYMKYAGEPITQWRFLNNEVYEVPRGLVDQVNESQKRTRKRSELMNADGVFLDKDQEGEKIHEFVGVL